jgi:hypothetical protein
MSNNIDQALAALGDALKGIEQTSAPSPKEIARKLPLRSLTGDHINGGKIQNFASAGITDTSTKTQLTIDDFGVHAKSLTVDSLENLTVGDTLKVNILEVKELKADIKFEKDIPITFSGDQLDGKGLLWAGKGNTKQFIFASNPDRFFVSENIDFAKGKSITVNNIKLIDEKELGPTITKSNLREVGRLKGLLVDGSVVIDQYIVYNSDTNRLGLGIEEPNAAFSVAEDGVEVVMGSINGVRGFIGTYASHNLEIVTDNTARITVEAAGNIILGNPNAGVSKITVFGNMGINVNNPDPRTALHVNGAIKFNNNVHLSDTEAPTSGTYTVGDIVWNSNPQPGRFVGWVCTREGGPGLWSGFGRLE